MQARENRATRGTSGVASTITIRPVREAADYEAALEEIAALMDAPEGNPDADRLDVLTTLVEAYEATHYPMALPDPIEAIRFRMEQAGLTARDLEPFVGSRARVSEVLNRRRPLSLAMIRRLADGLGIPAAVLILPTGAPVTRSRVRPHAARGVAAKRRRSTRT